jgi:hypothetical protein
VRTLVPPTVFEINASLIRGGVTPIRMAWGDPQDRSEFELLGVKKRRGEASLFTVPKLFVKTTLITMDGIGDQKPPGQTHPATPAAPLPRP